MSARKIAEDRGGGGGGEAKYIVRGFVRAEVSADLEQGEREGEISASQFYGSPSEAKKGRVNSRRPLTCRKS